MYVICNRSNLAVKYAPDIKLVRLQRNGVVVPTTGDLAEAIYCPDDDSYWPLKADKPWDTVYHYYSIKDDEETIPAGADPGVTYFDRGAMSIDPDLKQAADAKADAEAKAARVSDQATYVAKLYAEQQTDEAAILTLADLYDEWQADTAYTEGKILSYGKDANGDPQLYKVAQAHTSQADWTPDKTPALYSPIGLTESGVPIWRQPTGEHDAYNTGDQCAHEGYIWTSKIDGNTTEPGSDDRWWEKGGPVDGEPEPTDPDEPEPEPSTAPAWEDMEDGAPLKTGDHFTYGGTEYEVLRDMTKTPGWEPPALLGDYYKEAEA